MFWLLSILVIFLLIWLLGIYTRSGNGDTSKSFYYQEYLRIMEKVKAVQEREKEREKFSGEISYAPRDRSEWKYLSGWNYIEEGKIRSCTDEEIEEVKRRMKNDYRRISE